MPLSPKKPATRITTRPGWFGRHFGKRSASNLLLEVTLKEYHTGKKTTEKEQKAQLKKQFKEWQERHKRNPHNTWWDFLNHTLQK